MGFDCDTAGRDGAPLSALSRQTVPSAGGTAGLNCLLPNSPSEETRTDGRRFPHSQFPRTHTRPTPGPHRTGRRAHRRRGGTARPTRRAGRGPRQRHGRERDRHLRAAAGRGRQLHRERARLPRADGGGRTLGGRRRVVHGQAGARRRRLRGLEHRAADARAGAGDRHHRPVRCAAGAAACARRNPGRGEQP
ncbi:hypothetical protein D9M69_511330 [compost metagenome]